MTTPIARFAEMRWLPPALLTGCVVVAYANSFAVPLHLDDTAAITNNPSIERLWPISDVLAPPAHVPTGGRPLANLTFALNRAIGGIDVRGYHVVNLALHLGAVLTLFGIVRRTLLRSYDQALAAMRASEATWIGFIGALIWALHPLGTAAVTYLSQRTEVLMALCYLLTVYAFVRSCDSAHAKRWQVASVIACAAGMASKEPMMTAPVLVLFYDRTFVSGSLRKAWQQRRAYYAGLAATWCLLIGLLFTGLSHRQVGLGLGVSSSRYLVTECEAVTTYLLRVVWPWPLVFDYGPAMQPSLTAAVPYVIAVAMLLALAAIVLRCAPRAGFLLGAALLILLPTSSVVPVAMQPIAENRVYLPLAALAALGACAAFKLLGGRTVAIASVAAGALLVATYARNARFATAAALWSDTIAHRPLNPRAYDNYASALVTAGRLQEAIATYEHALELNPKSANTHAMLAGTWIRAGDTERGERNYQRALELNPNLHDTRFDYGMYLYHAGRFAEAATQLDRGLQNFPRHAGAHHYLALAYAQLNRPGDAITQFQAAIAVKPNVATIHCSYGMLLGAVGRTNEALEQYRIASRLDPALREALLGAASAAITLGRFDEAARDSHSALQLQPSTAEAHYLHGVALYGLGRRNDAAAKFQDALRLDPNHAAARTALAQAAGPLSPP